MRNTYTHTPMHAIILLTKFHCNRTATRQHAPGIDFDKIQHQRVRSDWQLERLLDVRSLALDTVATTDVAVITTFCDFAAVPSLKIIGTIE